MNGVRQGCHGCEPRLAVRGTVPDAESVDAGDLPVSAGDRVVLFGPGERGEPTVADWARWAETNPHEILTGVGPRVRRCHRGFWPGSTISTRRPSLPDECAAMTPS